MTGGRARAAALVCALVLTSGYRARAQSNLPLTGPAYLLADEAYKAHARGDYTKAAAKAREAQRLRPDAKQLATLLRRIEVARSAAAGAIRSRSNSTVSVKPAADFVAAEAGYKDYAEADYTNAAIQAREAVRLAPSNREHRVLLIDALLASSRLEEADEALRQATARLGVDPVLQSRRDVVRERMASVQAAAAYAALSSGDLEGAVTNARAALSLAPENETYRLVLIYALVQTGEFQDAEGRATEAHQRNGANSAPLVLRAYARQRLGRRDEAIADLDVALRQPGMTVASRRAIHLIAADAALAASEPARAIELLTGWPQADDEAAALRLRVARAELTLPTHRAPSALPVAPFVSPTLDCSRLASPPQCDVVPGAGRDPANNLADAAYRAFDQDQFTEAAAFARQAVLFMPDNKNYQALVVRSLVGARLDTEAELAATVAIGEGRDNAELFAQRGFIRTRLAKHDAAREDFDAALRIGGLPISQEIVVLGEAGRAGEARQRFQQGREEGAFDAMGEVDRAYLEVLVGEDADALASFQKADDAGRLPATALEDAAFTAIRAHRDAIAVGYFRRGIDAVLAGQIDVTPQHHFETRRAVSEVSRKTGLIASLTHRGPVAGLGVAPEGGADTVQAGVEVYWRPAGYRNARYFEVFARAFAAPYIKNRSTPFKDTLQSTIGVRQKPFHAINLVASFGRVFSTAGGRNDWLAQLGYSGGRGADWRAGDRSWWMTRTAAEAGRYLGARQNYGLSRVEFGRSFAISETRAGWMLFPHLSAALDYDSTLALKHSAGAGPGVTLRRWFHQDDYHAPRSTLEVSLQYRFRIDGAQRARGLFVNATLSY